MGPGSWRPAGVKKEDEVIRLFNLIFPGRRGQETSREIDEKMRALGKLPENWVMAEMRER